MASLGEGYSVRVLDDLSTGGIDDVSSADPVIGDARRLLGH